MVSTNTGISGAAVAGADCLSPHAKHASDRLITRSEWTRLRRLQAEQGKRNSSTKALFFALQIGYGLMTVGSFLRFLGGHSDGSGWRVRLTPVVWTYVASKDKCFTRFLTKG